MFLLTPPNVVHSERALTDYSNVFLGINGPDIRTWPLVGRDDASRSITDTCLALIAECRSDESEHDEMVDILMRRLGILLRRSAQAGGARGGDPMVDAAERIMEERYATGLTIEQTARATGCATSTLREKFVRHRGHAPHEHLVSIRLRHATSLLRNSTAPLEAIAMMTGFYSASHLSRTVRRATGKSPGAFRAAAR
jgi:transcriptional regulator GlxA family with amidase domain